MFLLLLLQQLSVASLLFLHLLSILLRYRSCSCCSLAIDAVVTITVLPAVHTAIDATAELDAVHIAAVTTTVPAAPNTAVPAAATSSVAALFIVLLILHLFFSAVLIAAVTTILLLLIVQQSLLLFALLLVALGVLLTYCLLPLYALRKLVLLALNRLLTLFFLVLSL